MRNKSSRGRLFALAVGIGFGVWFGAVLAASRIDQTPIHNEGSNEAYDSRDFGNTNQAQSSAGTGASLQGRW